MKTTRTIFLWGLFCMLSISGFSQYQELYRPRVHFSPQEHWMNDPNGMVYYKGEYHLFYQYFPGSSVWGPMHWGHAVSRDLNHWVQLPVALYPDTLGCIFSGSAVVDELNTTGFGKDGQAPMVAMFTYHNFVIEKAGRNDFQYQGIAYSNDNGRTWTKYPGNPVLKNPGIRDFRDPKVRWYEPLKKWILTLATFNCISFYSSTDMKSWKLESEFGKDDGQHGSAWECPDLFPLKAEGSGLKKWVLLVSINEGPNGGSATQYFVGEFDGKIFHNENPGPAARWVDYGKDNYAGVTWSGIPDAENRCLFLGWMSNWQYAPVVPTTVWRSAMTIPRELKLVSNPDKGYDLLGYPAPEFEKGGASWEPIKPQVVNSKSGNKTSIHLGNADAFDLTFDINSSEQQLISIQLINRFNENIEYFFDPFKNQCKVVRSQSGQTQFHQEFSKDIFAPVKLSENLQVRLIIDQSSVELFLNRGALQSTNLVFPKEIYNQLIISSAKPVNIRKPAVRKLRTIW